MTFSLFNWKNYIVRINFEYLHYTENNAGYMRSDADHTRSHVEVTRNIYAVSPLGSFDKSTTCHVINIPTPEMLKGTWPATSSLFPLPRCWRECEYIIHNNREGMRWWARLFPHRPSGSGKPPTTLCAVSGGWRNGNGPYTLHPFTHAHTHRQLSIG